MGIRTKIELMCDLCKSVPTTTFSNKRIAIASRWLNVGEEEFGDGPPFFDRWLCPKCTDAIAGKLKERTG